MDVRDADCMSRVLMGVVVTRVSKLCYSGPDDWRFWMVGCGCLQESDMLHNDPLVMTVCRLCTFFSCGCTNLFPPP